MQTISIGSDSARIFQVDLVGTTYQAKKPKTLAQLALAQTLQGANTSDPKVMQKMTSDYVSMLFNKKDAAAIWKRLEDDEDDLDILHITDLIKAVTEMFSSRPTTSPVDSAE